MQNTIKISISALLASVAGFLLAVSIVSAQASALEGKEQADGQAMTHQETTATNQSADDSYTYKAQTGDSYSEMARKAVQTYGVNNSVNLSGAQIIYAETILTNEAKAADLNIGQEVKISKDAVKKQVEAAQKLTEAQQKAWNYYIQFVDFDTDHVGQA